MSLAIITQLEPFNINSSATFSFASTSVAANVAAGNVKTDNLLYANGVAWSFGGSAYSNSDVANYLPTYSGLIGGTLSVGAQPNITSVGTLTSLTSGLITATAGGIKLGNIQDPSGTNTVSLASGQVTMLGNLRVGTGGTGNVTATYFVGNGSQLTGLPATYANSNVADYLPTYAGNLTAGNISTSGALSAGDATITGNLTVNGTTVTANVTTMNVKDPIIEMGGNTSGSLTSNDGKDRGTLLHYFSGTAVDAFVGWDNSNAEFAFGSNVSVSSEVVTFNSFGNVRAGYFIGNGSQLTGLPASYSDSNVATYLPTYTGNLSPGNLVVATRANLGAVANITITGGSSNQFLQTDGTGNVSWVTPTGTTITVDNFTGDGIEANFTLSVTPTSEAYTMVALAGTIQPRSVYTVTGTTLTFSSPPPDTAPIEVTTFSSVMGFGNPDMTINVLTANAVTANSITANALSGNIISSTSNLTVSTLTANSVVSGGSGTPTLQSNTSIVLSAATVVRVSTSPMQFYTCTSTVRDALAASDGYVIYNTTTNKLQVYANGSWVDLH